jgi:hypothetical protein
LKLPLRTEVRAFGRLVRVKRSFGANWDSVGDWPANRKPFTVEHELDEAGDRLLNGAPASGTKRGRKQPGNGAGKVVDNLRCRGTDFEIGILERLSGTPKSHLIGK